VTAETIQKFRQFLAAYEAEHPGVILHHAVGFLGHIYLIFAAANIVEEVRTLGIPCSATAY
jgi:hypothetical protein